MMVRWRRGGRAGSPGAPDRAHHRALHAPGRPLADRERERLPRLAVHPLGLQHARRAGVHRPASQTGTTFDVFALTVLPTLYVLGVFSFVRVVECGAEDFRYGVAINRIRNYYKQIAGDQAKLFLLSGHDDGRGVFENAAVPPEGRKQFFTFATVVGVINSVVGGSAIAVALGAIGDTSLGVAAGVGGVAALASLAA